MKSGVTKNIVSFASIISIDVLLGALSLGYFSTRILNVQPPTAWWFILAMSTWVIYTTDHLIDGYKNKLNSTIYRHEFHYRNRKLLLFLCIAISVLNTLLIFTYLDSTVIFGGLILIAGLSIYFYVLAKNKKQNSVYLQKELIIAVIYTLGIIFAPVYWTEVSYSNVYVFIFLVVFILVWSEGIIISWFDYKNDIIDNHTSFTVFYGKSVTRTFLITLHIIIELLLVIVLLSIPIDIHFWSLIILLIMNFSLGIIILFSSHIKNVDNIKIIGELVFVLPIFIALYG